VEETVHGDDKRVETTETLIAYIMLLSNRNIMKKREEK
jgi:hypothetical protein